MHNTFARNSVQNKQRFIPVDYLNVCTLFLLTIYFILLLTSPSLAGPATTSVDTSAAVTSADYAEYCQRFHAPTNNNGWTTCAGTAPALTQNADVNVNQFLLADTIDIASNPDLYAAAQVLLKNLIEPQTEIQFYDNIVNSARGPRLILQQQHLRAARNLAADVVSGIIARRVAVPLAGTPTPGRPTPPPGSEFTTAGPAGGAPDAPLSAGPAGSAAGTVAGSIPAANPMSPGGGGVPQHIYCWGGDIAVGICEALETKYFNVKNFGATGAIMSRHSRKTTTSKMKFWDITGGEDEFTAPLGSFQPGGVVIIPAMIGDIHGFVGPIADPNIGRDRAQPTLNHYVSMLMRIAHEIQNHGTRVVLLGANPVPARYRVKEPGNPAGRHPNMWGDPNYEAMYNTAVNELNATMCTMAQLGNIRYVGPDTADANFRSWDNLYFEPQGYMQMGERAMAFAYQGPGSAPCTGSTAPGPLPTVLGGDALIDPYVPPNTTPPGRDTTTGVRTGAVSPDPTVAPVAEPSPFPQATTMRAQGPLNNDTKGHLTGDIAAGDEPGAQSIAPPSITDPTVTGYDWDEYRRRIAGREGGSYAKVHKWAPRPRVLGMYGDTKTYLQARGCLKQPSVYGRCCTAGEAGCRDVSGLPQFAGSDAQNCAGNMWMDYQKIMDGCDENGDWVGTCQTATEICSAEDYTIGPNAANIQESNFLASQIAALRSINRQFPLAGALCTAVTVNKVRYKCVYGSEADQNPSHICAPQNDPTTGNPPSPADIVTQAPVQVYITLSGIMAAAHHSGVSGVLNLLRNGQDEMAMNGESMVARMKAFDNFELPNIAGPAGAGGLQLTCPTPITTVKTGALGSEDVQAGTAVAVGERLQQQMTIREIVRNIRTKAGIDPALISDNPSYNEIMQAMVKERFLDPGYYVRTGKTMGALKQESIAISNYINVQMQDIYLMQEQINALLGARAALIMNNGSPDGRAAEAVSK